MTSRTKNRPQQHDEHVLAAFLFGRQIPYLGTDGRDLRAKFTRCVYDLGVPSLTITDAAGKVVADVIMGEHNATSFFLNRAATAER